MSFKQLAAILLASDYVSGFFMYQVIYSDPDCPNFIRLFYLFDLLLTVLKVFNIYFEFKQTQIKLG